MSSEFDDAMEQVARNIEAVAVSVGDLAIVVRGLKGTVGVDLVDNPPPPPVNTG